MQLAKEGGLTNLEKLDINDWSDNWPDFSGLAQHLPELKEIIFFGYSSARAFMQLTKEGGLTNLEKLEINGCSFNWPDVEGLARHLPALKEIIFFGYSSARAFMQLAKEGGLTNLEKLHIYDMSNNWPVFSGLARHLPALKEIKFSGKSSARTFMQLAKEGRLSKLETLHIHDQSNYWPDFSDIALPALKKINFYGHLSPRTFMQLAKKDGLSKLEILYIHGDGGAGPISRGLVSTK